MSAGNITGFTPAEIWGPLFALVQERGILPDGKTFADAVPKRAIEEIKSDFQSLPVGDEALLRFVEANFTLPPVVAPVAHGVPRMALRDHIRKTWRTLARGPEAGSAHSSALPIAHRHLVPGGRFREIYYWDSFFSMLGLVRDGETALANGIVDAMTDLIEDHGHIPNGARTYYLGRSQPPLFHMMVALLDDPDPRVAARRLSAMKQEHAWWMRGADALVPGTQAEHVARLSDGSLLNRYWDPRGTPRDESCREDMETAARSGRPVHEVYRDLRAGAESGWDFSSRWLDGPSLASIRTTSIAPVDLNAFLFGLEMAIARSGDESASCFAARAERRRAAMHDHLWDGETGCFADLDLLSETRRPNITAAGLAPLFAGVATEGQAERIAAFTQDRLLADGGLRTTLTETGQQWDRPNGWAPLQWIAVTGLNRYGFNRLADDIADRWVETVSATYAETGLVFEKYDVESRSIGYGGEYAPQIGFGWTNGVTADFIDSRISRMDLSSQVHRSLSQGA